MHKQFFFIFYLKNCKNKIDPTEPKLAQNNPALCKFIVRTIFQSELLGQFRLISDRASDVSGGRICLTQNAYAEL